MTREEQILSLRKSVEYIAGRYTRTTNIPYDEFVSAGWLAAIKAVDSFEPSRNIKLSSFADYRIRGAMMDTIRARPLFSSYKSQLGVSKEVDLDKQYLKSLDQFHSIEGGIILETLIKKASFTKKQAEILNQLLQDKEPNEIAREKNVWPNTIRELKNTVIDKLKAAASRARAPFASATLTSR